MTKIIDADRVRQTLSTCCGHCEYDEHDGTLLRHCDNCCRSVVHKLIASFYRADGISSEKQTAVVRQEDLADTYPKVSRVCHVCEGAGCLSERPCMCNQGRTIGYMRDGEKLDYLLQVIREFVGA